MDKLVDKYAMDSLNHRYLENLDMNQNLQVYTCGPTSIIQVGQRHGRVNCFDVTGNLIIVIECKISAFFKKKKNGCCGTCKNCHIIKWSKTRQKWT